MAPRLLAFENFPAFDIALTRVSSINRLAVHAVNIPGSVSMVNLAMLFAASGTTAKTATLIFGLYSLNGSTLSLANSGSISTNPTANTTHWITFNLSSVSQDLGPGTWYIGFMSSTAGNSNQSVGMNITPSGPPSNGAVPGGVFFRGSWSVTTNALPASMATANMSKEGATSGAADTCHPYILISGS